MNKSRNFLSNSLTCHLKHLLLIIDWLIKINTRKKKKKKKLKKKKKIVKKKKIKKN